MEPVRGILKVTQREYVPQNLRLITLSVFSNSQIFNMERGLIL